MWIIEDRVRYEDSALCYPYDLTSRDGKGRSLVPAWTTSRRRARGEHAVDRELADACSLDRPPAARIQKDLPPKITVRG